MTENTWIPLATHYARILSPRGVYPSQSILFDDAAYISDEELTFTIYEHKKHTRGNEKSYSEVEWLNPSETRLYGSLMCSVDRDESYCAFYPYPYAEPLSSPNGRMNMEWILSTVKPFLIGKLNEAGNYYQDPIASLSSKYKHLTDISAPPIAGGPNYNFQNSGIDFELAKEIYRCIDLNDALVIRGLTALIRAAMLHSHYQFLEASIHSLYISMEVSFRLVVRALRATGIAEPTSKQAMTYIHDAFHDVNRIEKYFEDYYSGRVMTFHPESRYGVYPHAPLYADDYTFLFDDMLEVYAYLICGFVHPKHQSKANINY